MKRVLFSLLLAISVVAQGQIRNDELVELTHLNQSNVRTEIAIPGFDGYETLKCDFHIHIYNKSTANIMLSGDKLKLRNTIMSNMKKKQNCLSLQMT